MLVLCLHLLLLPARSQKTISAALRVFVIICASPILLSKQNSFRHFEYNLNVVVLHILEMNN